MLSLFNAISEIFAEDPMKLIWQCLSVIIAVFLLNDIALKNFFKNICASIVILLILLFTYGLVEKIYILNLMSFFLLIVYAFFFSSYSPQTKYTIVGITTLVTQRVLFLFWYVYTKTSVVTISNSTVYIILGSGIILLLLSLITVFLKCFMVKNVESIPKSYSVFVINFSLGGELVLVFLHTAVIRKILDIDMTTVALLTAVFIIINLILYYLFYTLTMSYVKSNEIAMLNYRHDNIMNNMEQILNIYRRMSTFRHEQKNYIMSIKIMLETKQYDKLEKYIDQFDSLINKGQILYDVGNETVNRILNYKQADLTAQNVVFTVRVNVPKQLPFEDEDLISLLVNLIDNGCEASLKTIEPYVSLKMIFESGNLLIFITNPVDSDILRNNPKLKSTKSDKSAHGFGLTLVKDIVKKYNGCINFEQNDNEFSVSVMLPVA